MLHACLRKTKTNFVIISCFNMDSKIKSSIEHTDSAGKVIYTAPEPMVRLIKMIKRLSISTTVISAGVQPFLFPKIIASGSMFAVGFASLTSVGILVSPLLLNWFTKRYVTSLSYDDCNNKFTAEKLNILNRPVKLSFTPQDVKIPEVLGVFTTFTVGPRKQPLFVDAQQVIDIEAYKKMLGYDKPIDLKREKLLEEIEKMKKQMKN